MGVTREHNPAKIQPQHEMLFNHLMLCERFGWTLDDVRNLGIEDYDAVVAILTGRAKAAEKNE